jgi:L-serine dehydratase
MAVSVFDIFTIGVGPSSSHTVGPMRAARRFAVGLQEANVLGATARVLVELYGSLGATGKGHGTDRAVMMGLEGESPEEVPPEHIGPRVSAICSEERINLLGSHPIPFVQKRDLVFLRGKRLPLHSNGMLCTAFDADGKELYSRKYYSVGGGFVAEDNGSGTIELKQDETPIPYPFSTGAELLRLCAEHKLPIWKLVLENEKAWRTEEEIHARLDRIWRAFQECVRRGVSTEGELPGGLHVKRRAPKLYASLSSRQEAAFRDPTAVLDWVSMYALAVNEENAAGGRVVTAPTNGAAGIMPSVLHYYDRFCQSSNEGIHRFILTAGGICILYMANASISGAEVGCQGEVGVACSMAAAGLTAALNGSNEQIENAAEIGMEHNLGLTCDPIGGLVQIPCIERNAMGSVKAINASRLAMHGDGTHKVSLDKVIKTMRDTGRDMQSKYKETSRGGLAVNVVEC